MSRSLPARPNLEQLKTQAKELLRAFRAGDPDTLALFRLRASATLDRELARLATAQFVLAREYGFASWDRLVRHIEEGLIQQPSASARPAVETRQQTIERMARELDEAATAGDFKRLFAALQIGRRIGDAVRARLVTLGAYSRLIDALLAAAVHPQDRVRFLAAQAMDHYADPRCAEVLANLLDDRVPRVRWAAIHSLQCAECKLEPLTPTTDTTAKLIELALHDSSIKVRRVATFELGQVCADPRVVAALRHLVASTNDTVLLRHARNGLAGQ